VCVYINNIYIYINNFLNWGTLKSPWVLALVPPVFRNLHICFCPACQVRVVRFYVTAGPQLQALDRSVPRPARTASSGSFPAGPQPRAPDQSVPCRKESPKIGQIECQKECQKMCQRECQKECQNICQKVCQIRCQTEWQKNVRVFAKKNDFQMVCQKLLLCQNNGSGWGSLEENNFYT